MAVLSDEQRTLVDRQGYVVVDGVLDPERDIAPVMADRENANFHRRPAGALICV